MKLLKIIGVTSIPCFSLTGIALPLYSYSSKQNNLNSSILTPWLKFSKNRDNVVVLFFDELFGMESYNYIYKMSKHGDNIFNGFRFYLESMSANNSTNSSVPVMVGGTDFQIYNKRLSENKNLTLEEYNKKAYDRTVLKMYENGFDQSWSSMQYFSKKGFWDSDSSDFYNHYKNKGVNDLFVIQNKEVQEIVDFNNASAKNNAKDLIALNYFTHNAIAANTLKPQFKFHFFESTHSNYPYYDADHNIHIPPSPSYKYLAKSNHTTIDQIIDLITWMKSEGVYDNSTIIIVSDHGPNPKLDRKVSPDIFNYFESIINMEKKESKYFRSNPTRYSSTFMIKPNSKYISKNSDLFFNDKIAWDTNTPILNSDLPEILNEFINKKIETNYHSNYNYLSNPLRNSTINRKRYIFPCMYFYDPNKKDFDTWSHPYWFRINNSIRKSSSWSWIKSFKAIEDKNFKPILEKSW